MTLQRFGLVCSLLLPLSTGAISLPVWAQSGPAAAPTATTIPVRLTKSDAGRYQLLRAGKPYFIQGGGGSDRLELLSGSGGNSLRTWDAENKEALLDKAQRLGLTVTLGMWLGHKEHGFKYDDPQMVATQLAKAKEFVERYRHHPAVLVWAIGNEMEGDGKDPNVWKAIEEIAAYIKKADPDHPTMTVIAEIGAEGIKAKEIARLCPSIDILGVNSYGGAMSLPERLKAAGWQKPYVITEFGPNGPWEVGKTKWGAALEPSSTAKAADYLARYQHSITGQSGWCLGSYAFQWGSKVEATPTWFGMFMPETGERLGALDSMTFAWTGKYPGKRVPAITAFTASTGDDTVAPGSLQSTKATVTGEGKLYYRLEIRPDDTSPSHPEPGQVAPSALAHLVPPQGESGNLSFTTPDKPGAYRLYLYVYDTNGGAATTNIPFLVK